VTRNGAIIKKGYFIRDRSLEPYPGESRGTLERGEIESKEKKDILADLIKRGEEERAEIEKRIKEIVEKTLSHIEIATKKDIKRLEEKLEKLEKKIK